MKEGLHLKLLQQAEGLMVSSSKMSDDSKKDKKEERRKRAAGLCLWFFQLIRPFESIRSCRFQQASSSAMNIIAYQQVLSLKWIWQHNLISDSWRDFTLELDCQESGWGQVDPFQGHLACSWRIDIPCCVWKSR